MVIAILIASQLSAQEADTPGRDKTFPPNHLAQETSPYLLMHAHNPVDWYPWGEEALQRAREQNKPIFLSIGYSSCHWCHVMEQESFEDEEIAQFLNQNFICIKVDREERPDIDTIYMESLQVINRLTRSGRGGGWPLTMFLTPEGKPFFGGTYFPARDGDRGAAIGFLTIVKKIQQTWQQHPDRVAQDAKLVTELTQKSLAGQRAAENATLRKTWTPVALNQLHDRFDPVYGGFGYSTDNPNQPKFPEPSNLWFLIDQLHQNADDVEAKTMLVTTCERMAMGGIHDPLGGGFHRYSVDRYWRIPHFEKMLYDNAQLASVYSEAWKLTGRDDFRRTVDDILGFVQRELADPEGGFYSALDADSEGVEGKFYRWEKSELERILSREEYSLVAEVYGLNLSPNFEGRFYVLQWVQPSKPTAQRLKMSESDLIRRLKPIHDKLLVARSRRVRPSMDNKILASWNGMMVRGFADAGRILENEDYLATARTTADFILSKMIDDRGRLYRTVTQGRAKLDAYLEDYACVIDGLLALHRATHEPKWLAAAQRLQTIQDEQFWDDPSGGYFDTSDDHEALIARTKRFVDGAMPSGNTVAIGNLRYLAQALNQNTYHERARQCLLAASPILNQFPHAAPRMLIHLKAF